jgi:Fe-S oxidoreductase
MKPSLFLALWLAVLLLFAGESLALLRRWGAPLSLPLAGLLRLPRRYLVDLHAVVAREPGRARMHVLAAGGFVSGLLLLLAGLLPYLRPSPLYWGLTAAAFSVSAGGAALDLALPRPPRFSRRAHRRFAAALGLFDAAAALLAAAYAARLPSPLTLPPALLTLAAAAALFRSFQAGPFRHAFAGLIHLAYHPRPERFGPGPRGALAPLAAEAAPLGIDRPSRFSWERRAGFDACIECGRCEAVCPAFAAAQPLNPKKFIQDLARAGRPGQSDADYDGALHPGLPRHGAAGDPEAPLLGRIVREETLWSCTTCRACAEACPMLIEHVDAMVDLRRFAVMEEGAAPPRLAAALDHLRYAGNAAGRPAAARLAFAAGERLRTLGPGEEAEVLLWLGEGAFEARYGRTLRALLALLRAARVDVAVLGEAERDCGDLARRAGDEVLFARLARANIATLTARRFRLLLTADPHAYHVLAHEYPAFGGHFTVRHHTQFLAELLAAGRLPLRPGPLLPLTYHDPCYLARYGRETEAPRTLLRAAGFDLREMPRHGREGFCCGGGGAAPLVDVPGKVRIADLRMQEAASSGAHSVAVACPGCTAMLEGASPRLEVRDVAELLAERLASPLPAEALHA